jgi:beta-lactamase class A
VPGSFTVAVTDLQTGHTIGVNDNIEMASGCIMNLFLIVEVLRQVDEGALDLDDVRALVAQTIYASDASTAYDLYAIAGDGDIAAGVAEVTDLIQDLGLGASRIDHPPAYQWEVFEANIITAREVNEMLAQLYAGQILNEELTAYLLEQMTSVSGGLNYLTAFLPGEATVSHKNGFFYNDSGWVDNDTAIVRFGPSLEYAYAITFLSDDVFELYSDIYLGQQLVGDTGESFSSRYPNPTNIEAVPETPLDLS